MLLFLCGCPWVDDATRAGLVDRDGDGVTDKAFSGDDCDDGDASVGAPGALYVDGDGDGVGGGTEAVGCSGDAGLVALGGGLR